MPYNQLTNLDYFDIRNALRDYLRANSDFTDYDFEGSVISNLLDVLAYNTYYTAFNTNMVANESFLESSTLRDNVVSIAKQLGYSPRSSTAARAVVNCSITFTNTSEQTAVFKSGSGFLTTIDNVLYQYILRDDVKASIIGNVASFTNLNIYEGIPLQQSYTVGNRPPKIVLNNKGIDVKSIKVNVYDSLSASNFIPYTAAENILEVNPLSEVYFISEGEDENYTITFGDGVLGKQLTPGQYVVIQYSITSGSDSNNAKSFVFNGLIEDTNGQNTFVINNISIGLVDQSNGGTPIESIESIKKNAPAMFGTQNRAVTADDYTAIVRRVYPSIADVYAYGGEDANPPEYGKVKIVIKPDNTDYLTSYTKNRIQQELRKFSVASVIPEIVDPSIIYIELTSKIYYNKSATNRTPDEVRKLAIQNIENYIKNSDTEKFGGKFRYSRFVSAIDNSESSIRSNLTTIAMRKDFYPSLNNSSYYELCFSNAFDYDCDELALTSTGFIVQEYPNYTCYMEDRDGKVILYRYDTYGTKQVLDNEIGTINYSTGEIKLYNLTIIKGSFNDDKIEVRLRPQYNDITAKREIFLDVDIANSTFTIIQE
jgi:hypothetical protein